MIEGIVICVLLVAGLLFLHWMYGRPAKHVAIDNLPPLKTYVPMPEVKPARQAASQPAFAAQYGMKTQEAEREWIKGAALRQQLREEREAELEAARRRESEYRRRRDTEDDYTYDTTPDLLAAVVSAAAAVVVAETIYDSFVDTSPAQEYSSPTPSYYDSSPDTTSYDSPSSFD